MAEVKYGQLASWDDGDVSGPNDFMNLVEGNNNVRVVTNPYQFVVHWTKDASGSNRKIRCAIDNCPLCRSGVKSQTRWYIGVIDRVSGQAKILEIGSQIYKGIKDYVSSDDWGEMVKHSWGEIMAYDINVKRGPKGTQPLYTVMGSPKMKDITAEEVTLVEAFLERVDISKFTQPSTPEEVAEKMGASPGGNGATPAGQQYAVGTQTVTNTEAGVKPAIEDDTFDFGDEDL
jgi:hypothetical protein